MCTEYNKEFPTKMWVLLRQVSACLGPEITAVPELKAEAKYRTTTPHSYGYDTDTE